MSISITAAEKKILQSVTIPPRPQALLTVAAEAKLPEPKIPVIAKAINSDIAISSAILQVCNSAAFRRSREIDSIDQAVMILGLKRLIPLVKAVALKASMANSEKLESFWKRSSDIANGCVSVAKLLDKPELADHAYMLGLFHAAGIPIMFQHFEEYADFLALAEAEGWDSYLDEERERFETGHSTIGAILAQQWKLPKVMIEVIYYLHDVDGIYTSGELNKVSLDLLSILKIARNVSHFREFDNYDCAEWLNVRDGLQDYLDLSDVEMEDIRDKTLEAIKAG
ncbi:MAG: HDOD domain-containing protein [Algicola sp.]|nr:HDOD domain-containing protein [Algicola sp.]